MVTYEIDGVEIHKNFIDIGFVNNINNEINSFGNKLLFNRNIYGYATINKYLKEIKNPASIINSVNLLELAIDVRNKVISINRDDFRLTKLALYIEKNNPKILPWHRDNDKGIITAQIYLAGGDNENSGAFQYMLGTHTLDSSTTHHLNEHEVKLYENKKFICIGNPGDLIHFNWFGYHSKTICKNERRTLFFEFQHYSHPSIKSDILLPTSKMSNKVLNNISLFLSVSDNHYNLKRSLDNDNLYISPLDLTNLFIQVCSILINSKIIARLKRYINFNF